MPGYVPSQILERLGYITSYNHDTKCPNWVAWHLTKERTDGPFPRKGVPYYDEDGTAIGIGDVTLETQRGDYFLDRESEEPRQLLTDWPNNEYRMTHGHICPAADNRWSKAAMNQSFLLTNMCPQDGSLNGGGWQKLVGRCNLVASILFLVQFTQVERFLALSVQVRWLFPMRSLRLCFALKEHLRQ